MAMERVIVVEHLLPSMSKDLLTKFPDNSALGFDYSQSSIWSPLVPRTGSTPVCASSPFTGSRKLFINGYKKVSAVKKQQLSNGAARGKAPAVKLSGGVYRNKKKNRSKKNTAAKKTVASASGSGGDGGGGGDTTPRKMWAKILKAAAKQFKKQQTTPSQKLLLKL